MNDTRRVLVCSDTEELQASLASGQTPPAFEMAGPRTQPASMAGAPTD